MAAVTAPPETDYNKLCGQLEEQEIESPGGVATPQVYGQLLGIYLVQNDLNNAKFLWKRTPQQIKTANVELGHLWNVGQKMWQRDFPAIYEAVNREWPEHLKPVITALTENTRKRAFLLVSQAYSSISGEDLASFMGMPVNEAVDAAVQQGWQADAQTRMVMPKKPARPIDPVLLNEQQLARLTDFVSFLEN